MKHLRDTLVANTTEIEFKKILVGEANVIYKALSILYTNNFFLNLRFMEISN